MKALRYAAGTLAALLVAGFPFLALTYSTGAPSGFSGPEQNCVACHFSFPVNSGTGAVVITAPPTFTPGVPVTLTVAVVNTTPPEPTGKQGFELSVRDASTLAHVGTFVLDTTTTQYAQGVPEWVTHREESNTAASWTFQWVPPATGAPENVTVYAAGNAANGNLTLTGDYIYTTSVTMARVSVAGEASPEALAVRLGPVAPNPVRGAAAVALTLDRPAHVAARLYDAQGRAVRTLLNGDRGAGPTLLRVETAGLAAGPYVLVVEAAGERVARPLTVAR